VPDGVVVRDDGRRPLVVLTSLAVAVTAVAVGAAVTPALRRAVAPGHLTAAAQLTSIGIPVPSAGHPCGSQLSADSGSTRWCLPAGTSAVAVRRWYDDQLPPGRSTPQLRWCIAQVQSDGSTTALWSATGGLVGYQLPPTELTLRADGVLRDPGVVVETVRQAAHACPRVARSTRSGHG
jgi:hypothetical protein